MFVSTSHHEGFCVSIVKSIAYRFPIVGGGKTANSEAMCSSRPIWEPVNISELGHILHRIAPNNHLYEELQERSWNFYKKHYSFDHIAKQLVVEINTLSRDISVINVQ